jgi:hypothetical protein
LTYFFKAITPVIIFTGGKLMENKSFQVKFCCNCGGAVDDKGQCKCKRIINPRTFFIAENCWKKNDKQKKLEGDNDE